MRRAADLTLIPEQEVDGAKSESKDLAAEVLSKPELLLNKVGEALNEALKVSVPYNPYTSFIWRLRKIPKKYIKEFYPELLNKETFQFIQELLGLREYIVPMVEDQELSDSYTIFSFDHVVVEKEGRIDGMSSSQDYLVGDLPDTTSYPYVSIGGCICKLNEVIWGLFKNCRDDLALIVKEVPNPFNEWGSLVGSKLTTYSMYYPYPENFEMLSRLDEIFPAVFEGELELVLTEDKKRIKVFRRWWG